MHANENFKYVALFQKGTGKFCTDNSLPDLVMGPETAKRAAKNDGCAVTICCITYKHEEYIRSALDSFLMQKTNFKFKVFVGEDHGPDGTADIVREYAEKYPDIIVPFLREKNMGAQANLIDLCNHADSPYIAFCEGDDYWVDEYKLQKQYDYMQAHGDVRVCFSKARISAPDDWFLRDWFKPDKNGELIFPDCEPTYHHKGSDFTCDDCVWVFPAHTSTVFYRWNYDVVIPDWYYTGIIGDQPIFLMQLGEGKAYMSPDITAVYRRSDVGVYMSVDMDEHFIKTRLDHLRWMTGMLSWYEKYQHNYPKQAFENRIKHESFNYLNTLIKVNDYDAVTEFFKSHQYAAILSLNAYLSFYRDSRIFVNAFSWRVYQSIMRKKYYLFPLKIYSLFVICFEQFKIMIKKLLKLGYNFMGFVFYWIYSVVPKRKNLWAITSFKGNKYLDNVKYFYEYIIKNHKEIEIYWLTNDNEVYSQLKKENKPVCKFGTRRGRKILSHAYIAITDHNVMSDYGKLSGINNRTKIVQLWHGVGFKAMGDGEKVKTVSEPGVVYSKDILVQDNDNLLIRFIKHIKFFFLAPFREKFEKYFLLVCPGQERLDMIADIWNIPRENCFMAGHPRNILLYDMKPRKDAPLIMYAPTFRYSPDKELDLVDGCLEAFDSIQTLMEKINGTFSLRLHPHTWRNYSPRILHKIKNYSRIKYDEEKDIYTTLGLYNIVISDYSSISLDFAMLDRPAIYYCPDIDWFKETQAGFNVDFENSVPGPITSSWEETLKCVEEYCEHPEKDADLRAEKLKYFFDKSVNGPDNSERIVNEIKKRLGI